MLLDTLLIFVMDVSIYLSIIISLILMFFVMVYIIWNSMVCNAEIVLTLHHNVSTKCSLVNKWSVFLWHKRLCHISKEMMERLIKNQILPDLDFTYLNICVNCIKRWGSWSRFYISKYSLIQIKTIISLEKKA